MKGKLLLFLTLCCVLCSCESQREKKAIKICQETKIQISLSQEENDIGDPLTLLATKIGFSLMGLDFDTSTWLDMANKIAELHSSEKFHWAAKKTDTENVYQVAFLNEEDWGYFWEVNIKENIVRYINEKETLSRSYGHSRLDQKAPFAVENVTVDTLKKNSNGIYYEIHGDVVNNTGKSLCDARLSGRLSVIFDKKTEEADNDYSYAPILNREISESNPWYNNQAIPFKIRTKNIKTIYLDYNPEFVYFTIEMDASDPIGYNYNKAIYEMDMKDRWNAIRKNIE